MSTFARFGNGHGPTRKSSWARPVPLEPTTRRPKSAAAGVGAQAHLRYCPACGQKRTACRCEADHA